MTQNRTPSARLAHPFRSVVFYCAERCLRRILPPSERNTTFDAALPTRVTKELPAGGAALLGLVFKENSLSAFPCAEWARKSAEVPGGTSASISPVLVVRV